MDQKERERESGRKEGRKEAKKGVPFVAQQLTNLTSIHIDMGLIPGLTQWLKDPVLSELWCRPDCRSQMWLGSHVVVAVV